MAGKAPRSYENGVAAKRLAGGPLVAREPDPSGPRDSALLRGADRGNRGLEVAARLHFDKSDDAAPPDDKIDLAAGNRITPLEDRITLELQQQGRNRLGLEAKEMGDPASSANIRGARRAHCQRTGSEALEGIQHVSGRRRADVRLEIFAVDHINSTVEQAGDKEL